MTSYEISYRDEKAQMLSTTLRKNQATHTEKPAHEFSSISQTCVYYVDLSLNKPF